MGILAEMLTANTRNPEDAYSIMEDTGGDVSEE
jgi:hypothetical protein